MARIEKMLDTRLFSNGGPLVLEFEREIAKYGASKVLVWLDPDDAGIAGRRKIVPHLRSMGIDAKAVRADLDPKCYSLEDICRKLRTRC